jgi:hypothetical protein
MYSSKIFQPADRFINAVSTRVAEREETCPLLEPMAEELCIGIHLLFGLHFPNRSESEARG